MSLVKVAAGEFYDLCLSDYGTRQELLCIGDNQHGQLGIRTQTAYAFDFVEVPLGKIGKVADIAAGRHHSLLLNDKGGVFAAGFNKYGQLGLGNNRNVSIFTKVPIEKKISKISAGWEHSLLLDSKGKVYAAGYNETGQLGTGNRKNQSKFVKVKLKTTPEKMIARNNVSIVLGSNNSLYAAGEGYKKPFTKIATLSSNNDNYTIIKGTNFVYINSTKELYYCNHIEKIK